MAKRKRLADLSPEGIFRALKEIAPSIVFSVEWARDPHARWQWEGPDPREEGMEAYDVTVSARSIVRGEEVEGRQGLGDVYDPPDDRDPDIHGYLPQMLEEAVGELIDEIQPSEKARTVSLLKQAKAAKKYLGEVLRARYDRDIKSRRRG